MQISSLGLFTILVSLSNWERLELVFRHVQLVPSFPQRMELLITEQFVQEALEIISERRSSVFGMEFF